MTIFYKIRYKDNPELYIKGTPGYQSVDKSGRTFQSIGALRTFLTGVMNVRTQNSGGPTTLEAIFAKIRSQGNCGKLGKSETVG